MKLLTWKPPERQSQRDPRDVLTPLQEAAMRLYWHYHVGGGEVNWNFLLAPDEETRKFMTWTEEDLLEYLVRIRPSA